MANKVLGQYTLLSDLPSDSLFYTVVSGVTYKTTIGAIQSGFSPSTLISLSDTPSSYATTSSRSDPSKYYFLSVNSPNTATEFAQVRFTDLNETPSSLLGSSSDSYGQKFFGVSQGASTITAEYAKFTGLNDVPHSYSASSLYLVRVNAGETALEFVDPSSIIPNTTGFLQLNDTPSSYIGQAGNYLRVDSSETGVEFTSVAPSSSSICGETIPIKIPASSSAVEQDSFPETLIRLQSNDGDHFVYSSWMKPTGFDSGKDITIDICFFGVEHSSTEPRYYYNLFCVTGTTGTNPSSFDKSLDAPLLTDYVDMTDIATQKLVRKRHTFSALLSDDVAALYFCLQRTNGTSGAENLSGIFLNRIGLTYHQN